VSSLVGVVILKYCALRVDAWGPFLIISPASTLHNWQQEMARFVPDFKVVPYWGSPQVRCLCPVFYNEGRTGNMISCLVYVCVQK
jgi:DNA helicase INO80